MKMQILGRLLSEYFRSITRCKTRRKINNITTEPRFTLKPYPRKTMSLQLVTKVEVLVTPCKNKDNERFKRVTEEFLLY
mgnify:CR=1 FL=1